MQGESSADIVLIHSCHLSNCHLQIVDTDDGGSHGDDAECCAKVVINGITVAYGFGASQTIATLDGAENALRLLVENGQPMIDEVEEGGGGHRV